MQLEPKTLRPMTEAMCRDNKMEDVEFLGIVVVTLIFSADRLDHLQSPAFVCLFHLVSMYKYLQHDLWVESLG